MEERSGVTAAATTAADRTREVAHDATTHAGDLVNTAREQAGEVGHELVQQGRRVLEDAQGKLREETETQSRQAVAVLREWSERGRALAEGRTEEAGPLAGYAREVAGKVSDAADRMEARGFDGVVEDVKSFARRRPGLFLLGAGVAGFAVGRLVRGAKSAPSSAGSGQTAVGAPAAPYTPAVRAGSVAAPSTAAIGVAAPGEGMVP